jgi:redox-sensing transcriptional repressor
VDKVHELGIEIGSITCPPERAQRAATQLVDARIKGILNYSAARISVPNHVFVEYVNFFHQIYSLTFNISTKQR